MPNQKGSLKDRIRSWNIFLRYKLKLKKQRRWQEKQRRRNIQLNSSGRYYSKPKVFYMTVLGLFAGLFEKKNNYDKKVTVEKQIFIIKNKVENNIVTRDDLVVLKKIEKEIINLESNKKITEKNVNNYQVMIDEIKAIVSEKMEDGILPASLIINTDIKEIIKPLVIEKKKESNYEFDEENKKEVIKPYLEDSKKATFKSIESLDDKKEVAELLIVKSKKGTYENDNDEVNIQYNPISQVKVLNSDLKKCDKELKQLGSKIRNESNYNNLYEYEFQLKQLKIRLDNLLNKHSNLKTLPEFQLIKDNIYITEIDIYNLRNNDKGIKQTIVLCGQLLDNIEIKKQELFNIDKSKDIKKDISKNKAEKKETEDKSTKENEKEEKSKYAILEVMIASRIISDNINKEKKKIEKFNRSISKLSPKQKRHSIFYYSKNIVSSVINFGLSLFPISFFRNKLLGLVTSGILINNSLRNVRKVLNPNEQIDYLDLEGQLNSVSHQINHILFTCDDSLRQIENIRQSLHGIYGNDIEYQIPLQKYLQDLSVVEQQILAKREIMIDMNNSIDKTRQKNKQKIMMFE